MESEEIKAYRKAGKIASEAVRHIKGLVKKDMLLIDIARDVDKKIKELGGKPAFPVNLSLNEIAAHYTPSQNDETRAQGLLKIDIGVQVNGFIADTAFSVDLSDSGEFSEMIKLNEELVNESIKNLTIDSSAKEIGNYIAKKIKNTNYSVIKSLSGHLLEKDNLHAGVNISNHENGSSFLLKDNAFAIEPFLTEGEGDIYEGKNSEIFILEKDAPARDRDARELLNFIKENYGTLPFCRRWLEEEGFKKLDFLLPVLCHNKILHNYPVLIEKSKKPVSQFEHTVIITDKVEVTTK